MEVNTNPKSYNNPVEWDKIESKDNKTKKINFEDENFYSEENEDIETIEGEDIFQEEKQEDFSEVLELTAFNDNNSTITTREDYVIAEYKDINIVELEKKYQLEAQRFVSKITKFVLEFNDVALTEEHKIYLKQVGKFQLQHLSDMLYMVSVNKMMLNNIIARVNATQAEDYAILNAYTNLANQHLKFIKELQNSYKSIPSIMKKMRAEIICNQEIEDNVNDEELITGEFGETQFNNGKQMLREVLKKREEEKNEKNV
jgi:hypothetical protein